MEVLESEAKDKHDKGWDGKKNVYQLRVLVLVLRGYFSV